MPIRDTDALVDGQLRAEMRSLGYEVVKGHETDFGEIWHMTAPAVSDTIFLAISEAEGWEKARDHWFASAAKESVASILPPTTSAGDMLNECIAEIGGDAFVAERDSEGLWAVRTLAAWQYLNRPSAGDGELVERLRRAATTANVELALWGDTQEGRLAAERDDLFSEAADHIEALLARVKELEEALTQGAAWFDEYADQHALKVHEAVASAEKVSRTDKAVRNRQRADHLRSALNLSPTEQEIQS